MLAVVVRAELSVLCTAVGNGITVHDLVRVQSDNTTAVVHISHRVHQKPCCQISGVTHPVVSSPSLFLGMEDW